MWTRAELKDRAKMCLSRYYWAAFAVSLIFAILSGFGGSNANTQRVTSYLEQNATGSSRDDQSGLLIGELGGDGSLSGSTQSGLASGIELVPGLGDAYGPGAGKCRIHGCEQPVLPSFRGSGGRYCDRLCRDRNFCTAIV